MCPELSAREKRIARFLRIHACAGARAGFTFPANVKLTSFFALAPGKVTEEDAAAE